MKKKQLKIRIREDGAIHAETIGIKGEACLAYIQLLENLLEAKTTESSFTNEYFETNEINLDQLQQNQQNIERE